MRRPFFHSNVIFALLVGMLLIGATALAQSLGDVARENRDSKATAQPTSKVITNKDLTGEDDPAESPNTTSAPQKRQVTRNTAAPRETDQRAAAFWKQRVVAQKNVIANLQARADLIRASLKLTNAGNAYEGPALTRYQARQLDRLQQTELQIEQQKRSLEDLQEAARRAGMHTAVYDP